MKNLQTLFPQFQPELISLLEKESTAKTFRQGDMIIRSGQYIKSTLLLISGRIKIYRNDPEGNEFLMYYINPGEACAVSMICAIQAETSEITAVAEEETEVLMIPVSLMEKMMAGFKSWYQFVIQTYRSRFDELLTVIDNIAFRNMDERLGFYLKRYAENTGKKTIALSHQQIAEDLATSREVISRLLKKMEQAKLVRLHRNMVELL
jgi:CRP/FNR family transcriptional regulator, anaerobic regulatory protein